MEKKERKKKKEKQKKEKKGKMMKKRGKKGENTKKIRKKEQRKKGKKREKMREKEKREKRKGEKKRKKDCQKKKENISVSSRLFLKLLAEGSRADLLGKLHASFRMRGHLRPGLQSPCRPRPRGRRHRARTSKRWERDLVTMCHQTFASRAVLSSSRWVELSWIAKHLYCGPIAVGQPDAKLRSPFFGQLADAAVQAVQQPAEESFVTASLSSLTACRTCRR